MKVLFVDNKLTGHHLSYLKQLSKSEVVTPVFYLPERSEALAGPQEIMKDNPNSFSGYLKWIRDIARVAKKHEVDLIHFVYGDVLYKGFGIGLSRLRRKKVIATFHQVRRSLLRDLSRRMVFRKINTGVVHTEKLNVLLKTLGNKNIQQIEYPQFNAPIDVPKEQAQNYFSIPPGHMTFLALGGTREDKGLDILLNAFARVDLSFHLFIAGKEETFTKEFIESEIENYRNKVTTVLRFLSEEEMGLAIAATDVVVLPYRKIFDGASGPLAEGIWNRKIILSSNHGSLGDIVERNKLGITFESEDVDDLRKKIINIITSSQSWNSDADKYRDKIDPDYFLKSYEETYLSC